MFERYTEKARRVLFFARYEASQFGSEYVETEHLLMGMLREDKLLANRFLRSSSAVESIRKQIKSATPAREKIPITVDIPLSPASKRILAFGAEESHRLNHRHIGPTHLLAGVLREEKCFAAEMLAQRGIHLDEVREELAHEHETAPTAPAAVPETPKFKIPPNVVTEIARQAHALGVDTYTHFIDVIRKGLKAPETKAEIADAHDKLRETYHELRGRIQSAGMIALDTVALDDEIARRKGKRRQP